MSRGTYLRFKNPRFYKYRIIEKPYEVRLKENCYYAIENIATHEYLFISQSEGDCFKWLRGDRGRKNGSKKYAIRRFYSEDDLLGGS